jgi:hypothetical protein
VVASATWAAAVGPAQGADCRKLRESRGCTLPSGAQYFKYQGASDQIDVRVSRGGKGTLRVLSNCVIDRTLTLRLKGRAKVGGVYRFKDTRVVQPDPDQGQRVATTYVLDAVLRITSAGRASLTGTATASSPAVPPSGTFGGEDAFESTCKLNRTLARAKV